MSTFDLTTPHNDPAPGWPEPVAPDTQGDPFDALDMLREQVRQREADAERTAPIEIPGIGWRLICATDFEYARYKTWQKAALRGPRKRVPDLFDLDQPVLGQLMLVNTCESLEWRRGDGEWQTLTGKDGEPLTLKSPELLEKFNVIDPRSLVRALYHTDAALIQAMTVLVEKSGYAPDDDEDGEPDPLA